MTTLALAVVVIHRSWLIGLRWWLQTFEDKDGNLMVPLQRKKPRFLEPGLKYRYDTGNHGGTTTPPTPIAEKQFLEMYGGVLAPLV